MSSLLESLNLLLYILKVEFSLFVIVYFILINIIYFLMLISSFLAIVGYIRRDLFCDFRVIIQSEFSTPISVLAPAYNEQATIVESVNSLLKLDYSTMEVIVINDGSKDETLSRMIREFNLRKTWQNFVGEIKTKPVRDIYVSDNPDLKNKLIVVDKENGGKADALNVGVNVSHYPLFCAIDADSILERDALLKVAKPFLEDDTVMAVGGIVRIANGCDIERGGVKTVRLSKKHLPVFQIVEYFRAFLSGRMGWSKINGLLIISGAFGLFRKDIVLDCGGYLPKTVGEDMELIAQMHRYTYEHKLPHKVVFVPDPVCWTEAPETTKMLSRQRNRWHRGLLDTLWIHRSMIFNRDYGVIGMLSMPYYLMFELLGPAIEMIGYVFFVVLFFFGYVNVQMFGLFFIVAIVYGMLFSVGAVLLEEISFHRYPRARDLFKLIMYAVLENFGYRQMTVLWRIKGIIDYIRGVESWGTMQRTGFVPVQKMSQ
jgi:cellulose synthase/poly-beta-1,6-N-acetylglucosamine synthase-like glycosyltransferase